MRQEAYSTTAFIIEAFNAMSAGILACGMVRATAAEDPGQAGDFVSGTPGAGQTQVQESPTTGAAVTMQGYKTYKLPDSKVSTNPIFVRCHFSIGHNTTVSRLPIFSFGVKLGAGSWSPNQGVISGFISMWTTGANLYSFANSTQGNTPLVAACGEGYFYVSTEGSMRGQLTNSDAFPPIGYLSSAGIAVMRPSDSGVQEAGNLFVCAPSKLGASGTSSGASYPSEGTDATDSGGVQSAIVAEGVWASLENKVFPSITGVQYPSANGGLRVAVPSFVFSNRTLEVGFGVTSISNVPVNGTIIDLDLGLGPTKYRAMHGFCDPTKYSRWQHYDPNKTTRSVLLMPWE